MTNLRETGWLFHPGEYLEDELKARGWTTRDVAIRASDDPEEQAIIEFACDMLIACSYAAIDEAGARVTIGDCHAGHIAKALGTTKELWLNLDKEYHKRLATYGKN